MTTSKEIQEAVRAARREVQAELRAERIAAKRKEMLQSLASVAALAFGAWWWFGEDVATAVSGSHRTEAEKPAAQINLTSSLEGYRDQYQVAKSNKNDIQQNRVADTQKAALCQTSPDVYGWLGKVYRVNTNIINSRSEGRLTVQVSDNVWLRGEMIEEAVSPELFEVIANLKVGDKIRVSGTLYQREGCVTEMSLTQSGGMRDPEFLITYSAINGVEARKPPAPAPKEVWVAPSMPLPAPPAKKVRQQ
jgi:hypothetical protein